MKRTLLFALMIPLLLSGCGLRDSREVWQSLSSEVAESGSISFTASVTTHDTDMPCTFRTAVVSSDGETVATVTEPESIRGVRFRVDENGEALEFDDAVLFLPGTREDADAPCVAPEVMLASIRKGYLVCTGREGDVFTATVSAPGGETVNLWYSEERVPLRAEILHDGVLTATLVVSGWKADKLQNGQTDVR